MYHLNHKVTAGGRQAGTSYHSILAVSLMPAAGMQQTLKQISQLSTCKQVHRKQHLLYYADQLLSNWLTSLLISMSLTEQ